MTEIRTELSTKMGIFAQCWNDAIAAFPHFGLVVPLLPLLVAEAAWLVALASFPHPPLDALLVPAWVAAGGDLAVHYPDAYAWLPRVASWGVPFLVLATGVPGLVVTVAKYPAALQGERPAEGTGAAARARIPTAWLASLPGALLGGGGLVAADLVAGPPASPLDSLARDLFSLAFLTFGLLGSSLFAYALPAVVLGGVSARTAWERSLSIASRYLGISAGFVLAGFLFSFPLRVDPAILRGLFRMVSPESMLAVAAFGLLGAAVGAWLLAVTTTRLYLHRYGVEK
jgi:hypothetical protein